MIKKDTNKQPKDISEKFKDFPSVLERGERDEDLVMAEARIHHPDYPLFRAMSMSRESSTGIAEHYEDYALKCFKEGLKRIKKY